MESGEVPEGERKEKNDGETKATEVKRNRY